MADSDEPIISEVHMETCPPRTASWCTRFCFSVPGDRRQLPKVCANIPPHQDVNHDAGAELDEDGDVVIPSRPARREHYVLIHHSLSTPVSRCGEQVWMGACLLSDLILSHQQLFCGQTIVELGAGVGLVSIVAALFAKHVLLTDADEGALQLASRNAADNAKLLSQEQRRPSQHTLQQPGRQHTAQSPADSRVNGRITIRGLNWLQLFGTQLGSLRFDEVLQLMNGRGFSIHSELASPAEAAAKSNKQQTTMSADSAQHQQVAPNKQQEQVLLQRSMWQQRFQWQGGDLAVLAAANIWLAADVIYNETLTDAFVRTAHQLMTWQCKQQQQQQQLREATAVGITCSSAHLAVAGTQNQPRSPRLFVAVEKRYNFTLRDLDARASAFDHFMTYVKAMDSRPDREQPSEKVREPQPVQDGAAAGHGEIANGKTLFWGTRWQVEDIPQVLQYDRSGDLELWELTLLD